MALSLCKYLSGPQFAAGKLVLSKPQGFSPTGLCPLSRGVAEGRGVFAQSGMQKNTPLNPLSRGDEDQLPRRADVHVCRPIESSFIAAHVDIRRAHFDGRIG